MLFSNYQFIKNTCYLIFLKRGEWGDMEKKCSRLPKIPFQVKGMWLQRSSGGSLLPPTSTETLQVHFVSKAPEWGQRLKV